MTRSARPARRVGCVSNLPSRHRRDTMRAQADAAKKAKAHANKKGKKAVSKRAPKKKKTYDSDEESDGYDDDSEDDWGTRRCRIHTFGT
mmetsp:Transcript_14683/g.46126  ORF Transcript_14683/g.46126 Transcript_14683/m.46126 type:complete len:89 (-) Transcript_14683:1156-1422(-)